MDCTVDVQEVANVIWYVYHGLELLYAAVKKEDSDRFETFGLYSLILPDFAALLARKRIITPCATDADTFCSLVVGKCSYFSHEQHLISFIQEPYNRISKSLSSTSRLFITRIPYKKDNTTRMHQKIKCTVFK